MFSQKETGIFMVNSSLYFILFICNPEKNRLIANRFRSFSCSRCTFGQLTRTIRIGELCQCKVLGNRRFCHEPVSQCVQCSLTARDINHRPFQRMIYLNTLSVSNKVSVVCAGIKDFSTGIICPNLIIDNKIVSFLGNDEFLYLTGTTIRYRNIIQ